MAYVHDQPLQRTSKTSLLSMAEEEVCKVCNRKHTRKAGVLSCGMIKKNNNCNPCSCCGVCGVSHNLTMRGEVVYCLDCLEVEGDMHNRVACFECETYNICIDHCLDQAPDTNKLKALHKPADFNVDVENTSGRISFEAKVHLSPDERYIVFGEVPPVPREKLRCDESKEKLVVSTAAYTFKLDGQDWKWEDGKLCWNQSNQSPSKCDVDRKTGEPLEKDIYVALSTDRKMLLCGHILPISIKTVSLEEEKSDLMDGKGKLVLKANGVGRVILTGPKDQINNWKRGIQEMLYDITEFGGLMVILFRWLKYFPIIGWIQASFALVTPSLSHLENLFIVQTLITSLLIGTLAGLPLDLDNMEEYDISFGGSSKIACVTGSGGFGYAGLIEGTHDWSSGDKISDHFSNLYIVAIMSEVISLLLAVIVGLSYSFLDEKDELWIKHWWKWARVFSFASFVAMILGAFYSMLVYYFLLWLKTPKYHIEKKCQELGWVQSSLWVEDDPRTHIYINGTYTTDEDYNNLRILTVVAFGLCLGVPAWAIGYRAARTNELKEAAKEKNVDSLHDESKFKQIYGRAPDQGETYDWEEVCGAYEISDRVQEWLKDVFDKAHKRGDDRLSKEIFTAFVTRQIDDQVLYSTLSTECNLSPTDALEIVVGLKSMRKELHQKRIKKTANTFNLQQYDGENEEKFESEARKLIGKELYNRLKVAVVELGLSAEGIFDFIRDFDPTFMLTPIDRINLAQGLLKMAKRKEHFPSPNQKQSEKTSAVSQEKANPVRTLREKDYGFDESEF
eukprot:m.120462 g.120462  ORF g.120462 m.120462 type:complete len:789 (+) comp14359_c0_seq3:227-2593(+)